MENIRIIDEKTMDDFCKLVQFLYSNKSKKPKKKVIKNLYAAFKYGYCHGYIAGTKDEYLLNR